jgi:hypothetical protein
VARSARRAPLILLELRLLSSFLGRFNPACPAADVMT